MLWTGWFRQLVDWVDPPSSFTKATGSTPLENNTGSGSLPSMHSARGDAKSRLRLVLMHDRTQLSPATMEQLRDELVEVISKYVEIDKDALELNLESESNTIALVANIPVVRARTEVGAAV